MSAPASSRAQSPVSVSTPQPGWVEQDAEGIWTSVRQAAAAVREQSAASGVFTWDGSEPFDRGAERFVPAASPVVHRDERRAWLRGRVDCK